ncbi:ribosomal L7Ae/L30e/S12e/Gadd45 family protein [Candidatus Woesearchaeota archaeon]|nr:ribosomal L7Ae/L30e/S12e/Gadd45 family protein [Candidatus Woesearchaeota archaeon]
MAKKISAAEIKKLLKSGNVIIGTERTIKSLKLGKVQKVLVSSNCPARVESDLNHYSQLSGAELHKLDYPNDELSIICKKPFSISVLAFLKGASK